MPRRRRHGARAIAALLAAIAVATAHGTTLDELAGRRGLTVGPLVLSNFVLSDVAGVDPASVKVEPEAFLNASGTPLLGVRFSGPVALSSQLPAPRNIEFAVAFDAALADDELSLAGLTHATVGTADGSGAMSNETVVLPSAGGDGTPIAEQRSCLAGRPCPDFPWTPDVSAFYAPASAVHVEQTFRMLVGGRGDAGSARLEHLDVLFWLAPRR